MRRLLAGAAAAVILLALPQTAAGQTAPSREAQRVLAEVTWQAGYQLVP